MKRFLIFIIVVLFVTCFLSSTSSASEPCITFTFDDGSVSVFGNAFPVLDRYEFPAVAYLITDEVGKYLWRMDWDQIKVLSKHRWEIGSHSHTHPDMTKLKGEEIEKELDESISVLKNHSYKVLSYASPYGNFDDRVLKLVKERFQSHRRSWDPLNNKEGFNDSQTLNRYDLSAVEIKNTTGFEEVKALIDSAVKEGTWLILFFHSVVQEPKEYQVSTETFGKIVDYVHESKIKVITISEYLSKNESFKE